MALSAADAAVDVAHNGAQHRQVLIHHGAKVEEVFLIENAIREANLRGAPQGQRAATVKRPMAVGRYPGNGGPVLVAVFVQILEADIRGACVDVLQIALECQNAVDGVQRVAELDVLCVESVSFSRLAAPGSR